MRIFLLSAKLIGILVALFAVYLICFHYGWGMDVHSWTWVFACWWSALFFAGAFALPIWNTPLRMAAKTAIYLATIFALSCWAIIYGWGMHPRNWWLVIIPYAIAGCLPPFNTVSKHLMFWRKDVDPTMQALMELHNAADEYLHGEVVDDKDIAEQMLREVALWDALLAARNVAAKGEV